MNQTAFDFDAPAQRHSPTSVAAAEAIGPHLGRLQVIVLDAIRNSANGLTDNEIIEVTGLNPSTARPRRIELERARLIYTNDTRETASGRQANVWRAK